MAVANALQPESRTTMTERHNGRYFALFYRIGQLWELRQTALRLIHTISDKYDGLRNDDDDDDHDDDGVRDEND